MRLKNLFKQAKLLIMIAVVWLSTTALLAQQGTVKGKVTDSDGNPLIGATVVQKGTGNGTVTDLDGNYTLANVPAGTVNLEISYVGYLTENVSTTVADAAIQTADISLVEDLQSLDEVVVIGYGTQKKSDLTGAVASVSAEDLQEVKSTNVQQALQGKAAGVQVISATGAPGSTINIRVRGVTSVNGTNPLWIVDGVPSDPNTVNVNDIESFEILKDASSAAIYGSNAANGVVLVTTKKGKSGNTTVNFNASYGFQKAISFADVNTGPEFGNMYTEYEALLRKKSYTFSNPDTLPTYDYQNEMFRTAPMQSYDLGISGGNEKSTFYVGIGYVTQQGILRNSDYDKLTLRINSSHKANKWFEIGENISFTRQKRNGFEEWQYFDEYNTPVLGGATFHSFVPFYIDQNGNPAESKTDTTNWSTTPLGNTGNPLAPIELTHRGNTDQQGKATFYGIITPIKGLQYEIRVTGGFSYNDSYQFQPVFFITPSNQNKTSKITRGNSGNTAWQLQNYLTYSRSIMDVHNISLMAGFESGESFGQSMSATREQLINETEYMWYFDASQNDTLLSQLPTGTGNRNTGYSYFGRIGYDFKGIFLGQFNVRKDYSSKFGPKNRSGVFPSFSAGIKISELNFVKDNLSFLSFAKIRYGWGKVGNNAIGDNVAYPTVAYQAVWDYNFDQTQAAYSGAAPNKAANPAVKWESVITSNWGLDLAFLNNKLSFTGDLFSRKNEDMLMEETLPGTAGYTVRALFQENNNVIANPISNIGKLSNKGIELSAGWKESRGKLSYSANFNFTYVETKADELSQDTILRGRTKGINALLTRTIEGQPIGEYYGLVTEGLFQQSDAEIIDDEVVVTNQPFITDVDGNKIYAQPLAQPGDFKFKDVNNDGVLDESDVVPIGNPNPKFIFGLNLSAEYGWFDITAFFQGVAGNKNFNAVKFYQFNTDGAFNWSSDYIQNHYREDTYDRDGNLLYPANFGGTYPRLDPKSKNANFSQVSDFYMENASYLRLKTLQVGMTLPLKWSQKAGISKLRLYVNAQNLLTFTKYSGFDPEVGYRNNSEGILVQGLDKSTYPAARMYTFGLNLTF